MRLTHPSRPPYLVAVALSSDHPSALARRRRRAQLRRQRLLAAGALVVVVALCALVAGTVLGRGGSSSRGTLMASQAPLPAMARRPAPPRGPTMAERERRAVERVRARMPWILHGGRKRREIALTFDDGPGPFTPQVLQVLRSHHVPATFFSVGFMERWFHASTVEERRMGDAIGNHTETHPMLARLAPAGQAVQIAAQTQEVERQGVPRPTLFRPPYGSFNAATIATLKRNRMLMVLWSADTEDYRLPGTAAIVRNAVAAAKPGAIILMHDAGGQRAQTIAALPTIIRTLRAKHFRLVTVPRMMLDDPPRARQRLPRALRGVG